MRPASSYPHVRLRAPRKLIDVQTDAVLGVVRDLFALASVLAFAAGVTCGGPLLLELLR